MRLGGARLGSATKTNKIVKTKTAWGGKHLTAENCEIPITAIDYLLHNYNYLKREVESIQLGSKGFARIPTKGATPGDPVATVAIKRAELSMVLDAVDFAWRHLTPELRRIARAKYRRGWSNQEIAKRYYLSLSTVSRRLTSIRTSVAGVLATLPDMILTRFWHEIDMLADE